MDRNNANMLVSSVSELNLGRPCVCCRCLCEFVCVLVLLGQEGTVSLESFIPSGSYSLSDSASALPP